MLVFTAVVPKMQKHLCINETQVQALANKAWSTESNSLRGYMSKKSSNTGKWQLRYFILYQNCLFYYENDKNEKMIGVTILEGCYCDKIYRNASDKLSVTKYRDDKGNTQLAHYFVIYYKSETPRQYDFRCETEVECNTWVEMINQASYSKCLFIKEELKQKHLYLLKILDSERKSKWQYVQCTEELSAEVKKLKIEIRFLKQSNAKKEQSNENESEDAEIAKIKKVQSFFRGWKCRRRWKQIVEEYIHSEHAEAMRMRNAIVFRLVKCETDYVERLSTLVLCFLRPFKMAASSKKPIISHDDVNSIFLNVETVLFLHQVFLQGLKSKMECWPTLQLGDLFDILMPMLSIYQEYVCNHHFSLEVLTKCKTNMEFTKLLARCEEKCSFKNHQIEAFLTYPMHQIPHYISTLHQLLKHTPNNHLDRKKLEFVTTKLEELSNRMHDEVSETENIRKNLAIERMIVEGCDILLDINQIFVRQGPLIQVINEKRLSRSRLGNFSNTFKDPKKEIQRQIFLFTNHLLITTRIASGQLHLEKNFGKLALAECSLLEDTNSDGSLLDDDALSIDSTKSMIVGPEDLRGKRAAAYNGLDFCIFVHSKVGPPFCITLLSASRQEKAAWCSDINQCIEQQHYNNNSISNLPLLTVHHYIRTDARIFRDDVDIKFSRSLNTCKVPQIRYASVERLFDRLIDSRFFSIEFFNTFLLTYLYFTDSMSILNTLKQELYNSKHGGTLSVTTLSVLAKSENSDNLQQSRLPHQLLNEPKLKRLDDDVDRFHCREKCQFFSNHRVFDQFKHNFKAQASSKSEELGKKKFKRPSSEPNLFCSNFEIEHVMTSCATKEPFICSFVQSLPKTRSQSLFHFTSTFMESNKDENVPAKTSTLSTKRFSIKNLPTKNNMMENDGKKSLSMNKSISLLSKRDLALRVSEFKASSLDFVSNFTSSEFSNTAKNNNNNNINNNEQCPTTLSASKRMTTCGISVTMRVINILRHWIYTFPEDLTCDPKIYKEVESLLEVLMCNQNLNPSIQKTALQLLQRLKSHLLTEPNAFNIDKLLKQGGLDMRSEEDFDTISAFDLAEQLTFLDHHILRAICRTELLKQSWMKDDRAAKAINVTNVSKQFNHVCQLVVSEIVSRVDISDRVAALEKWVAVANNCRALNNFNGVLQICAALSNSSINRLKKTWEKLSRQTRQTIVQLQTLVSSDCRFKNLRDTLHSCDPPCIPYLGMYLTDLSFIEEGSNTFTSEGFVNFCKMRMLCQVIREIQRYQQTLYQIKHQPKVTDYLLDESRVLNEEQTYEASLAIEPKKNVV